MTWIALGLSVAALVVALHSVVYAAAAGWFRDQARWWRIDPEVARARDARRPWYVRYSERA